MKSILKIVKKNFKLLSRSRSSALIIILGPLLMIFLVGLAFNNSNQYEVNVGVYSSSYSDLSTSIVAGLDEKSFSISRYNHGDACVDALKQGMEHICLTFSPDLQVDSESNEINFTVDYSKVNLVWMVLDAVSQEVTSKSSSLTTDMTNVLIQKLERTKEEMAKDSKLILELTSGNKKMSDKAKESISKIGSMRVDIDMEKFPVQGMVESSNQVESYVGYLIQHTEDLISSVTGDILALDINATMKEPILDTMEMTKKKISNVRESLEKHNANLSESSDLLEASILDLKKDLDQAGAFKTTTVSELDDVRDTAAKELQNILLLKNSFDKIENEIASIQVFDAEDIAMPITTNINPITSEVTHLNNMFPSLVVLIVMFISILLSSTLVIMEKRSKAYLRNLIVPTNDIIFVLATLLTSFIVVLFQIMILLLAAQVFFGISIFSNLHMSLLTLFLVSIVFILIGMTIGYVFSREEAATLASISAGSIMLFLSSVIIPIESMPSYIINIVKFNPFVLGEGLFRKTILFGSSFGDVKIDILILFVYALVLFGSILFLQYLMKKLFILGAKHQANVKKK